MTYGLSMNLKVHQSTQLFSLLLVVFKHTLVNIFIQFCVIAVVHTSTSTHLTTFQQQDFHFSKICVAEGV